MAAHRDSTLGNGPAVNTPERPLAARFATLAQGRPKKGANLRLSRSTEDAAGLVNVAARSVDDVRAVLASGNQAAIAKVERGEVSVSRAAKEVRDAKPSWHPLAGESCELIDVALRGGRS